MANSIETCRETKFEEFKMGVGMDPHRYSWGPWINVKEIACLEKDGQSITLQERECGGCGLIQQRRVRL